MATILEPKQIEASLVKAVEPQAAVQQPATREPATRRAERWSMADIVTQGAARWGDRLALADAENRLTFLELRDAARAVAERLANLGVAAGDRVAVAAERNVDGVVAILGTCWAGATYVPLDPEQPPARLRFALEDADVAAVIAPTTLGGLVHSLPGDRSFLELTHVARSRARSERMARPAAKLSSASVAYIMYTSGSSGVPKGVQIEHGSVRAFFEAHNERARIEPGDRCLNSGPFHFDVSLMDVFLPLYVGASVFFGSKLPVGRLVLQAIAAHRITHYYAVGSILAAITRDGRELDRHDLSSLRLLATGAEVCNVRVVNEWLSRCPRLAFLNSYGPTEATVGCISHFEPGGGPLGFATCPIGKPHHGTAISLLRGEDPVHDPGAMGELVIAGPQVMRGYWRRPREDERAFVWLDGVRHYRTGDYGYRDAAGDYHFVCRMDDEIKLNGNRIHLNEVLHALHAHPSVEAAVAGLVGTTEERPELAVVIASGERLSIELAREVEARAATLLPLAMRPARFGFTARLPRLSSGKVDRPECLRRLDVALRRQDVRHFVEADGTFSALSNGAVS